MTNDRKLNTEVRLLSESDSLEELTGLLNRAYKSLSDMGLKYVASWQGVDITKSRLKNALCFIVEIDGRITGTISYRRHQQKGQCPWFDRDEVAYIGQLAVEPDLRMIGIGNLLMSKVEEQARLDEASEIALDTADPATQLIEWYTRLGYRLVDKANWKETNYQSVIMSKSLK